MSLLLGSVLANTLASLSGGGAGLLQFPLVLFLGLPFSVALATHKLASVALGLGAVVSHFKNRNIHSKVCLWIITFGSLGVVLGAHLILLIPEVYAQRMLGVIILLLGVYSRLKTQLGHHEIATNRNLLGWCFGTVLIILIGIINGSLTAGSGLLVTLLLVRWFGYSYKQAVAITIDISWFGMERTWWYYHIKYRRTCALALVTSTAPWIVYWWNTRSKPYSPLTQLHH